MNPYIPIIVSIVAALGTVLVAYLTVRAGKRKTAAEATQTLTDIAMGLVTPLKEQIDELTEELHNVEAEVSALKKENKLLHRWAQLLYSQVLESGHDPISFERVQRLEGDER